MLIGEIGCIRADINVNKCILKVSVGTRGFEILADTETEAYEMQEEYSGLLKVFLQSLKDALVDYKKGGLND